MIGLIFYLCILISEIRLLSMQLKSKSIDAIAKRKVRMISFSLYFILAIIDVFSWGFRYYLILVIYLLLISMNEIYNLRSKSNKKPIKSVSMIKKSISILLIFGIAFIPAILFPVYTPIKTTGVYDVLTHKDYFVDTSRMETFMLDNKYRQISVDIWYPKQDAKTFPLIIYSHGGISLPTSNESLYRELASHGYIVFSIGHPYHSIRTTLQNNQNIWINKDYMNELNQEDASNDPVQSLEFYQKWMDLRTSDINFAIEHITIKTQSSETHDLYKAIDTENIGVMGHSLGGSAALCSQKQSNIKAIIALESPFMCDIVSATDDGFIFDDTIYQTPILNIYSDSAYDQLSTWPQYKKNYNLLSSSQSHIKHYYISGTHHFSLTDLSLTSPILTRLLNGHPSSRDSKETLTIINSKSLQFFNDYLK